jgi:ubiquinol-cytochrome C reductase complex subunit VI
MSTGGCSVDSLAEATRTIEEWQANSWSNSRYDDILDVEESDVGQMALKRLSAKDSYDRVYRIRRAVQLSLQHKILPKDEWTKMEDVSFAAPLP